jgi:RNA 2',3'-cyclic 3'-phosphodiesterase
VLGRKSGRLVVRGLENEAGSNQERKFALRAHCRQDVCAPSDAIHLSPNYAEMKEEVSNETWRVFCAIDVPQSVRASLMALVSQLREEFPHANASWSRPDNIHLTLNFFGEIPRSRVDSLSKAAEHAARSLEPFTVSLDGTGVFPTHGAPRVLWVGIEDPDAGLGKLYKALEAGCSAAGFPREERPFHAHITIARIRRTDAGSRDLAHRHRKLAFTSDPFKVNTLRVIRSILDSRGSRYLTLADCPLGSGPAQPAETTSVASTQNDSQT